MSQDATSAFAAAAGCRPGSRVAGYVLGEQLGQGGMAVVFSARDERLGRRVALKILAPALAADEVFRQRFIRESRSAAAVDDPHIVPVYDAGEAGGILFIAMRFVSGGDVRSLVTAGRGVAPERASSIVAQAASALDAAHRAGLVHRDVKPANMLIDVGADGRADHIYLSDFGLSKGSLQASGLTQTGTFLGTLDYISPEQVEGGPVDGRADQYALACTAFELLSGSPPFQLSEPLALMNAHLHEEPPWLSSRTPGLPRAVDEAIARSLAKNPADRYPTCSEFAAALRTALGVGGPQSGQGMTVTALPAHVPVPRLPPKPSAPPPGAGKPPSRRAVAGAPRAVSDAPGPAAPYRAGPPYLPYPPYPSGQRRSERRAPLLIAASAVLAAIAVAASLLLAFRHPSPSRESAGKKVTGQVPGSRSASPARTQRSSGGSARPASRQSRTLGSSGYAPAVALSPAAGAGITGVTWNSAGTLAAVSSKDGSTYIWNAATGRLDGPPLPGPAQAFAVAFSPDGSLLATGYQNGTTYLWSMATRHVIRVLSDPGGSQGREVDSLAFSPDGATLATADGNGYVGIWSIGSGQASASAQVSMRDPAGTGFFSLAFSSRGALVAGDYAGHVYSADVGTGTLTPLFALPGSSCAQPLCAAVSAVSFSRDGTILAAGNESGYTELWDVAGLDGRILPPASAASPAVWGLSFDGHDELAMACGNGDTYLWQVEPAALSAVLDGTLADPRSGGQGVGAAAFSPDDSYLATGDTDGTTYLWRRG